MLNLNPCGDLTPEVKGQEDFGFTVLGFFVDFEGDKTSSWDVYVAISQTVEGAEHLECYCPQTQHMTLSRDYMESCERITKEEYLAASGTLFTPADYLVEVKQDV